MWSGTVMQVWSRLYLFLHSQKKLEWMISPTFGIFAIQTWKFVRWKCQRIFFYYKQFKCKQNNSYCVHNNWLWSLTSIYFSLFIHDWFLFISLCLFIVCIFLIASQDKFKKHRTINTFGSLFILTPVAFQELSSKKWQVPFPFHKHGTVHWSFWSNFLLPPSPQLAALESWVPLLAFLLSGLPSLQFWLGWMSVWTINFDNESKYLQFIKNEVELISAHLHIQLQLC